MRYAIVSDIHSNIEALRAVFERLSESDQLLCLGDVVGYGPNPNECVELVRARATACILGNHDVAAIDSYGVEFFNPAARDAIAWTQTVLSGENAAWLDGLAYELRMPDFLMVHGAPVTYFSYILDIEDAERAFAATDAPLVFVGHSHVAEWYGRAVDGQITHAHVQRGGSLELVEGVRYIVNVGSVGQPRDLNPDASFAFYDSDSRTISWERTAYPIGLVQAKIEQAHLPQTLAKRLSAGR